MSSSATDWRKLSFVSAERAVLIARTSEIIDTAVYAPTFLYFALFSQNKVPTRKAKLTTKNVANSPTMYGLLFAEFMIGDATIKVMTTTGRYPKVFLPILRMALFVRYVPTNDMGRRISEAPRV